MTLKLTLKQLKALSDRSRLRMFLILSEVEEVCSCDFAELFGFAAPTISRHTSILREADLICCRKEGRWVFFSINEKSNQALDFLQLIKKTISRADIEKDIDRLKSCKSSKKTGCGRIYLRKEALV